MSCYLIMLYRKYYVFYRTLNNCTNRIYQALQHTYFILCFLIQMKLVCDAFLDLFSNLFSLVFFFKLWLTLLLNIENNQKKLWKRREWREKKKKIFNSKKEFVRVHSFMRSAKGLKFEPPSPSSPLCINIQFWSKRIPLLDVLNSHSNPAPV